MKLPLEFLQSLEGVEGFNRQAFEAVHEKEEGVTSIRINPAKWPFADSGFNPNESINGQQRTPLAEQKMEIVPWSRYGRYLEQRPSFTFDPYFHAGCYYVQEASSMFLEQVLTQLVDLSRPIKVLDLCASPGGKSTHLQSLLSAGSLLVSNEVIKQRSIVLTDNIIKWGCSNVVVTNNDPRAFQKLPGFFDLLVVDAPCSGSGLFRKDKEAIGEWSLHNVALCSQRQQRILADALTTLKEDGLLVYSTCSYSAEEDEAIMDWLVEKMEMENMELPSVQGQGIVITRQGRTTSVGYRFYPDKVKGEGFFLSCFRKKSSPPPLRLKAGRAEVLSLNEKRIVDGWITNESLELLRFRNSIIALPQNLVQDFSLLQSVLNIQYAGISIGEIFKEKLVPHHAFAQSLLLSPDLPYTDLTYENAIKYLQRNDFQVQPQTLGWQVVRYGGKALGWINALANRVNNYYPKEIRILKQNNTPFEK